MSMPKLVSIAPDAGAERYIALDDTGQVWHGRVKREPDGDYIEWTALRCDFQGV